MKLTIRPWKRWLLAGLLLAASVLALLGPEVSNRLRGTVNYLLAPFGDGGMYLAAAFKGRSGDLGRAAVSPKEARRLIEANRELLGRLHAVEGELARVIAGRKTLGRLYGQMPYEQWELIPARVVGADSLPYGRVRVVSAGNTEKAVPGAPVTTRRLLTDRSKSLPEKLATISATALVGELIDTGRFTAHLRLLTDKGFRIHGKIMRVIDPDSPRRVTVTGPDAVEKVLTAGDNPLLDVWAHGDGAGGMEVRDVKAYDNVRPGDWLLTAGEDAMLPARIRIGRVVEVTDDPRRRGLFVTVHVKPHADMEALREVYIVVPVGAGPGEVTEAGG